MSAVKGSFLHFFISYYRPQLRFICLEFSTLVSMTKYMHSLLAFCYSPANVLMATVCYMYEASRVEEDGHYFKIPQYLSSTRCVVGVLNRLSQRNNWITLKMDTVTAAESHRSGLSKTFNDVRYIWVGYDQHETLRAITKEMSSYILDRGKAYKKCSEEFWWKWGDIALDDICFLPDNGPLKTTILDLLAKATKQGDSEDSGDSDY